MTNKYQMTPYNTFIAKSRYSRFLDDKNRREHWGETVARYFDFMEKHLATKQNYTLTAELRKELQDAVTHLDVVPSMRAVMTAGTALDRQNVAAFNCWTMNFAPLFKDTKMERTWVYNIDGKKKSIKEVAKTQGLGRRTMQFYPAVGGIEDLSKSGWIQHWDVNSTETLSLKKVSIVSTDGRWIFENWVNGKVAFFFNNWEEDHGCLHASPLLAKELKPGESAHASGSFKFTRLKK